MSGNMAGDFYKGKIERFRNLPPNVSNGIRLHRFIDDFTDNSRAMKAAVRLFHDSGIRRIGPIAGDILLDHYISANWSDFSEIPYADFINFIYAQTERNLVHLSPQFAFMYNRLKRYDWFNYYPTYDGISEILRQFSNRLSFENQLGRSAEIYRLRSTEFNEYFQSFLLEITPKCETYILDNLKSLS